MSGVRMDLQERLWELGKRGAYYRFVNFPVDVPTVFYEGSGCIGPGPLIHPSFSNMRPEPEPPALICEQHPGHLTPCMECDRLRRKEAHQWTH